VQAENEKVFAERERRIESKINQKSEELRNLDKQLLDAEEALTEAKASERRVKKEMESLNTQHQDNLLRLEVIDKDNTNLRETQKIIQDKHIDEIEALVSKLEKYKSENTKLN